jgi:hypothetical protein
MPVRVALTVHTSVEIKPRSERETHGGVGSLLPEAPEDASSQNSVLFHDLRTASERNCLMSTDSQHAAGGAVG